MKISRRNILKSGAALAAGTTTGIGIIPEKAHSSERAGNKFSWGHTVDFGEQYYTRMFDIISNIKNSEMQLIGDISSRMAETLKKGNNVYMDANVGHMGYSEFREENKGNPGILKSSSSGKPIDYDSMKSGDILMTNHVNAKIKTARDSRNVYVVGVPVNYVDNEWTPRGFVHPNENNWLLKDTSSVILQSYVPYTQGIVDCPQVPEMKICPSAANSLCSLYWMFQAEVANKLKNKKAKFIDKSAIYIDTILERISKAYALQKDYMFDHAATVAQKIGNGAHYHMTSDHDGVQSEATGVAMGPMMTNAFRDDMKKGDVHMLATIEPDSKVIIDEAKKARETGMFVVSIAPGNSIELRKLSDVFIDNQSPEGGGLFEIDGFSQKVATTGGVLNNWLMYIFTAQFIDEMVRRGWVPWFWMGFYQVGGKEYDEAIRPFFFKQGF